MARLVCQTGHKYGISDGVGETSSTRPINSNNGSVAAKTSRRRNASIPEVIASPSHDPVPPPPTGAGIGAGVGVGGGDCAGRPTATRAAHRPTPLCAVRADSAQRGGRGGGHSPTTVRSTASASGARITTANPTAPARNAARALATSPGSPWENIIRSPATDQQTSAAPAANAQDQVADVGQHLIQRRRLRHDQRAPDRDRRIEQHGHSASAWTARCGSGRYRTARGHRLGDRPRGGQGVAVCAQRYLGSDCGVYHRFAAGGDG